MKILVVLVGLLGLNAAVQVLPWKKYPEDLPYPTKACVCAPGPPICASNYKTYPNECEMRCRDTSNSLYVLYQGKCKVLPDDDEFEPNIFKLCGCPPGRPVCASNYKTYPSECVMLCKDKTNSLYVIHRGECARPGPPIYIVGSKGPGAAPN